MGIIIVLILFVGIIHYPREQSPNRMEFTEESGSRYSTEKSAARSSPSSPPASGAGLDVLDIRRTEPSNPTGFVQKPMDDTATDLEKPKVAASSENPPASSASTPPPPVDVSMLESSPPIKFARTPHREEGPTAHFSTSKRIWMKSTGEWFEAYLMSVDDEDTVKFRMENGSGVALDKRSLNPRSRALVESEGRIKPTLWTNKAGKTIEATFEGFPTSDQIHLRTADGKLYCYPATGLSSESLLQAIQLNHSFKDLKSVED